MKFSPLPLVLLLPGVVAWLIFSRLCAVIITAVACLIFSVQFLLSALHVAAVPWLIVSVLFVPAARHRMDALPVRLAPVAGVIFLLLPLVLVPPLVFDTAVPCLNFSPLPLVLLLFPAAVASLRFAPLPG